MKKFILRLSLRQKVKFFFYFILQDNELTEVPVEALRPLRSLVLLDLSRNRISRVPDSAFETLRGLTTLKVNFLITLKILIILFTD